jgi:hypothetical protein
MDPPTTFVVLGGSPHRSPVMVRILAAAALLLVACQAPPAAPSPSRSAAPVDTGSPATPGPTAAPTAKGAPPIPSPLSPAGALIDFHEMPIASPSGAWLSDWYAPPFPFTRLVPSWNADTPPGSWITIEAQARKASGEETRWWSFGPWAYDDADVKRRSVGGQRDADGRVETDTLLLTAPAAAYRFRVTVSRAPETGPLPTLRLLGAVVSDPSTVLTTLPSPSGPGTGKDLSVPPYSQEIHAGEYPEYDGGGEAWCSPASTAMILSFWGKGPTATETAWVAARYADPQVDHAARYTYDATYGGAGNWSFNTAYAARYGLRAFVTQLRSLTEAERFIDAGIPLVASVRVAPGALPGFLLPQGSPGHLLVIRGFTSTGDVIANDPAATGNDSVRRVYPRARFEQAWLGGSQGIVYVIHPATTPLPPRVAGASANW